MNWQPLALSLAGVIGAGTAIIHGVILQRRMVGPLNAAIAADRILTGTLRRLLPPLLHFSTFAWFAGGLALIGAAIWPDRTAILVIGAMVGCMYVFAAAFNFWATRGRHPGWMLMTVAVALIAFAAIQSGT